MKKTLVLLMLIKSSFATVVIGTVGPTTPLHLPASPEQQIKQVAQLRIPALQSHAKVLPLTTTMTETLFTPYSLTKKLPTPLFIIGSDERSLAWLDVNKKQLEGLHATGLIVEASTTADLKHVHEIAAPLTVTLAQGDLIEKNYGIEHYPALIVGDRVSQ